MRKLHHVLGRATSVVSSRGLIGLVLTLACLLVLWLGARLPSTVEVFRHVGLGELGVATLLSALTIVAKSLRWRAFYPHTSQPNWGVAVSAMAVGQMVNWALPARLGEVVRVGMVAPGDGSGSAARGAARATGVIGAEKLVDVGMLLLSVALLAVVAGVPGWLSKLSLAITALACLAVLAAGYLLHRQAHHRVLAFAGELPKPYSTMATALFRYGELIGAAIVGWMEPRRSLPIVLWSLLAWGLGASINYLVLDAVGLTPSLGMSLAVLVAIYGGAALPSLPGRVGVFQYLCIIALRPFDVGFEQALAFSVALYAVVYLPPITLGLLSMIFVRPSGRSPHPIHESSV